MIEATREILERVERERPDDLVCRGLVALVRERDAEVERLRVRINVRRALLDENKTPFPEWPLLYCPCCETATPYFRDRLPADKNNDHVALDVVCSTCKFIVATFHEPVGEGVLAH